jgi:hypothetical protein
MITNLEGEHLHGIFCSIYLHPASFSINEIIIIEVMFVYLKLLVACTNSKLSLLCIGVTEFFPMARV